MAEGFHELGVGERCGGGEVDGAFEVGVGDEKFDGAAGSPSWWIHVDVLGAAEAATAAEAESGARVRMIWKTPGWLAARTMAARRAILRVCGVGAAKNVFSQSVATWMEKRVFGFGGIGGDDSGDRVHPWGGRGNVCRWWRCWRLSQSLGGMGAIG